MKTAKYLFAALPFLFFAGCDSFGPDEDFSNGDNSSAVLQLKNGSSTDDYIFNPYKINFAKIDNDNLIVNLTYSGGCEEHLFTLVAYNYFLESFPVQADILLSHNANGDACEALINEELEFDLTPLKQEYFSFYGNYDDAIIINLYNGGNTHNDLQLIYNSGAVYKNSFESSDDTLGWTGITLEMFVDDPAPGCGVKSLYIGGGCIQPAAYKTITINKTGHYSISCYGKTDINGGNIILRKSERELISVNISSDDWTHYVSDETLYCKAGDNLTLEFIVGGFVFDALFCDELTINKM